MSDAIETNLWKRLRHTPLIDVLSGRITGRLNITARINAAELPQDVKALIGRVVKRTRLWRSEKSAVADELIAHFLDGLESGKTAEELMSDFGSEEDSASLIRRGVKRNRPLAWQIWRGIFWTFVALIIYYAFSAFMMVVGKPTVSVNYVDLLNKNEADIPLEQRAWPLYRRVLLDLKLNVDPRPPEAVQFDELMDLKIQPDHARWPELIEWLKAHQTQVDLVRQGAAKPAFGFIYGQNGSIQDAELYPEHQISRPVSIVGKNPLIEVFLPNLNQMRVLAMMLAADARVAQNAGDAPRLINDVSALLKMGDQTGGKNFLVSDLVAIAIRNLATTAIDRALVHNSKMFSDAQLQQLAHLLAKPDRVDQIMTFAGERMGVYDLVQRIYTDDGHGDGRITLHGLEVMNAVSSPRPDTSLSNTQLFVGLTSPVLAASRRELLTEYDRMMEMADANLKKPTREADWEGYEKEVMSLKLSKLGPSRYMLLDIVLPSLNRAQMTAEVWLGARDGVLVGIALEAHRRQHGDYPAALEALVPALLPSLPIDRISGGPLKYKLIDGSPVVYSQGVDRDDDGGQSTAKQSINASRSITWHEPARNSRTTDGDWVLYPQPIDEDDEK